MGIPLNTWNEDGLCKTVARFGELVSIAKETVKMENVQCARVPIRTINSYAKAKINGTIYDVRVAEEILRGLRCCHIQQTMEDSDDDQ